MSIFEHLVEAVGDEEGVDDAFEDPAWGFVGDGIAKDGVPFVVDEFVDVLPGFERRLFGGVGEGVGGPDIGDSGLPDHFEPELFGFDDVEGAVFDFVVG